LGAGHRPPRRTKKLRTFIPFTGLNPYSSSVQVGGVFELIQDMTEEYKSIVRFQYLVFGISLAFMGSSFSPFS